MVRSAAFGDLCFIAISYSRKYRRARVLRKLDKHRADSACAGVHEASAPRLQPELMREVMCGYAMTDCRRRGIKSKRRRNSHQSVRVHPAVFGIAPTEIARECDSISRLEPGHARPDRVHSA